MEPHFQLGIWPDYVFMWLSLIDNPKNEKEIAQAFIDQIDLFSNLAEDFSVSLDHTQPKVELLSEMDLLKGLERFRDVKKGELQVGRIIRKEEFAHWDEEKAKTYMLDTYKQLIPLYQLAVAQA